MGKKRTGRKLRVEFKQNRQPKRRDDHWTRSYQQDAEKSADTQRVESVRAKGDLSRKRTILVDADDAPLLDRAGMRTGVVTALFGLVNRVEDEAGQSWACTARGVLRTRQIQERAAVAVGDRVYFVPAEAEARKSNDPASPIEHAESTLIANLPAGVIEQVAPRRTRLSRRERRGREHTLVANADQLLIVSSIAQPRVKPHLIDRYLVAAQKGGLRPIVCFNKIDLLQRIDAAGDDDDGAAADGEDEMAAELAGDEVDAGSDDARYNRFPALAALFAEYEALPVDCVRCSASSGEGIDTLRALLRDHVTVVSGQSGVGKSSLLNRVQPGLQLATAEVSTENEKGRHTTSHARLHRLAGGGYVVDTPGIRQFDLWAVAPGELEACFVEFLPHLPHCRFRNCLHTHEQGCAVLAAVEAGAISERRYASYVKLFEEARAAKR